MGWRDFEELKPEVDLLLDAGFCLNQDAIYKWAVVMRSITLLRACSAAHTHSPDSSDSPDAGRRVDRGGAGACGEVLLGEGEGIAGEMRSLDIGAGSAPLQHWAAQFGRVVAIDINFLSSWFPIDQEGFYVGADKTVLPPRFANLSQVEGDLLGVLRTLPDASLDLVYDACSLIHMFPRFPTPADGLRAAMQEVHRVLRPGGVFVAVSDVAHPAASEVREFLHAEHLAALFSQDGDFEWLSPPDYSYSHPEDTRRFGDEAPCRNLTSAHSKATTWDAPLDTSNLHTCEELPEGTLRLLIASFALRKPELDA
ncbi:hypothetical protein T484DRAFT_1937616 [Baffinella frigidus]|nr:hypothetical protein T484DRAFT_1937616 [Cryptophyta sp. CCMP2293]